MSDARPRFGPLTLAAVLLASGCAPKSPTAVTVARAEAPDAGDVLCPAWGEPRRVGTIGPELKELSGLAASRAHPGRLYAHNDSGDEARFFALTAAGVTEYRLPGARNVDWEDLDLGPCPAGSCLYLGDIGDNHRRRADYSVFRVAEPSEGDGGASSIAWERLRFRYPQGASHNAEALAVHPRTGRVYVVTKEGPGVPSQVYRFPEPLEPTREVTLELVATLSVPAEGDSSLTGASLHPSGRALLLRLYNRLVELRLPEAVGAVDVGAEDGEGLFRQAAVTVPSGPEPQGEAVTYSADGQSYFTASERGFFSPVPLWEVGCGR